MSYIEKNREEKIEISIPFLAKYLSHVSGEDWKVYMAYKVIHSSGEEVTIEKIADLLETTEKRVEKSLSFWREKGMISEEKMDVVDISIRQEEFESVVPQIMVFAEIYLDRELTTKEIAVLNDIETTCHFDFSMFQFLFDYCINRKKKNFTYMKKVAESWKERGITEASQAEYHVKNYGQITSLVSKEFGITNRMLGKSEMEYIESWMEKRISTKLILEACHRTVLYTGKGSFPYADKILNHWISEGIKSLEDLKWIDQKHKESTSETEKKTEDRKVRNKFHDFDQRTDYDWDALEEALQNQ